MSDRRFINLPDKSHTLPFSDAVLVGDTLYLSGRIGFKPGGTDIPDTPQEEARNLLEQFVAVLREAGMTLNDMVYVQIFSHNAQHFDAFNSVYSTYFKQDLPARAFLGSGPLLFGARFEMQGIAVKR